MRRAASDRTWDRSVGQSQTRVAAIDNPIDGISRLTVGTPLQRFDRVSPGVRRYLRYTVQEGRRETVDIWERKVSLEDVGGRAVVRVDQRWDRVVSPASVRSQTSIFEAGSFRPLAHTSRVERDGTSVLSAYRFEDDRIVGDDQIADNSKSGFVQVTTEPTFNFETDLELFQALPWRQGYSVSLMFYDPGLTAPTRYVFRTVGSAVIAGTEGSPVDCWIVTADYNTGVVVKTFWIAKVSQLVVHEEAERDGVVYVKTLIGAERSDPM